MQQLADALDDALESGRLDGLPPPADDRDRLRSLRRIHALHLAPLDTPAALRRSRLAAEPAVALLKIDLERSWLVDLDAACPVTAVGDATDTRSALRSLAAAGRLPAVYRWVADVATMQELVDFLGLEGGPDADFDDLVADCQVGLTGTAKDELARNYWDEMGDGDPGGVHTTLHRQRADALGIVGGSDDALPVVALARQALGGLLATNHHLQPEMVGALGLTELEAGPRCRTVLQAFDRLGAPSAAYPFYRVHAEVDPRHGRDWLDNVVLPLVRERPEWGPRILRGAHWRKQLNDAFFGWAHCELARPVAA